jgi:hypothetical protein
VANINITVTERERVTVTARDRGFIRKHTAHVCVLAGGYG